MINIQVLMRLVEDRNRLCGQYEKISEELMTCGEDAFEAKFDRRGEIADLIDRTNRQIEELLREKTDSGDVVRMAVKSRGDRNDLPEELRPVFDLAQDGFACLNRVRNIEPLLLDRLQSRMQQLEHQIRGMKDTPKIVKYLQSRTSAPVSGNLFQNEI